MVAAARSRRLNRDGSVKTQKASCPQGYALTVSVDFDGLRVPKSCLSFAGSTAYDATTKTFARPSASSCAVASSSARSSTA